MAETIQLSVRDLMKTEARKHNMILKDSLLDQLIIQADKACPVAVDNEAFVEKAIKLTAAAVAILQVQKTPQHAELMAH